MLLPRMTSRTSSELSPVLKSLVSRSVALLGKVIQQEAGATAFRKIENIRCRMAGLRGTSGEQQHRELKRLYSQLKRASAREQMQTAHAFTLMLELMNACENAYRTHRLRQHPESAPQEPGSAQIIYVLTAHPSEARAPENIFLFRALQQVLVEILNGRFGTHEEKLHYLLTKAWRTPASPGRRPSVEDEAEHIFSILLQPGNIETLVRASQEIASIHIRTWVGGDKDGHPYVDRKTLKRSLQCSRTYLLNIIQNNLNDSENLNLARLFNSLQIVKRGDGARVEKVKRTIESMTSRQRHRNGAAHPALVYLKQILELFPGLVVPLELRESADLIHSARRNPRGSVIAGMLSELRELSAGGNPLCYARGLIISMASSPADVHAALDLVREVLRTETFPVIPLFEQEKALEQAPRIVRELLHNRTILAQVKTAWGGFVEIMLGYSDSAKEVGGLRSRFLIARAVRKLDQEIRRHACKPVFFHGSGGSVDRGGGSIDEQTAWWPESALTRFKATIQGEMVDRTFAGHEITRSQFARIAKRAAETSLKNSSTLDAAEQRIVLQFAKNASNTYRKQVHSPDFAEITRHATLYAYLSALRIGSRPAKRKKTPKSAVEALRAIPWVLCWTQSRTLFPAWWGIGSAWRKTPPANRKLLKKAFGKDALFRSYIKLLGFTLAKVELGVWRIALEQSGLSGKLAKTTLLAFESEYRQACSFVRSMSGEQNLLWFRPWLGESIQLRSPMIHPLNLLQISATKNRNANLLRTTVTGISSGMMTTG